MAKSKKKKSTGSAVSDTKPPGRPDVGQSEDLKTAEGDERGDYGGMPFRDLKKNLGCG